MVFEKNLATFEKCTEVSSGVTYGDVRWAAWDWAERLIDSSANQIAGFKNLASNLAIRFKWEKNVPKNYVTHNLKNEAQSSKLRPHE